MLIIRTCGEFDIQYNGISLLDGTDVKRGILLVYLWEQHSPQPRIEVARLLWPRVGDNTALVNLRSLLLRLRREGLGDYLDAGRSMLALVNRDSIDYDVARIRSLTTKLHQVSLHDLTIVAELYRGPFLQAAVLEDHPQMVEWAATLRAEMEIRAIQALSLLVAQSITLGHADMVLSYAEQMVALTPYEDQSQELYMRALSAAGRVSDALNHFYQYKRLKKTKFHIDQVGNQLSELVKELETSQLEPALPQTSSMPNLSEQVWDADPSLPLRFPYIEYPIVGRHNQTRRLLAMLDNGKRLITVIGIAGVGKTFFVRSQYHQFVERFGSAVYYVDLRIGDVKPVQPANTLLLAIATALGWVPQPNKPLFEQVVGALSGESGCLILDNFETVQAAASSVLALHQAIPSLTILVTSHAPLSSSLESVVVLGGLSRAITDQTASSFDNPTDPPAKEIQGLLYGDAIRYFEQCMQRQDFGHRIDDESHMWIETICRTVEALPLAIELAAMQVPYYSLSELATRVGGEPAVLSGAASDLPADCQSVWAVLDSIWQTLNDNQRRVLAELSVFAGVFHRDALMRVAPASRTVYDDLVNVSLLRVDRPAWFSLHPLVRVYAAHQLPADTVVHQRHAHYFLSIFEDDGRMSAPLSSHRSSIPLLALQCPADVILAWQWATNRTAWDLLDRALLRFSQYFDLTSQHEELIRHMSRLLAQLPLVEDRNRLHHRLAGRAAYILGVHHNLLPDRPMSLWYERSLTWLNAAGDPWDVVVTALAYVDELLKSQFKSWERVDSLLSLAAHLIEEHQLEPLRLVFDGASCAYFLYQGQWAKLRDTQNSLVARMAHPAHSASISAQLLYAALLDDWGQMLWLIDRVEIDNTDNPMLPTANQWGAHFLGNVLAHSGDIDGAIAQRLSIVDGYVDMSTRALLPMAYGELAFWQHIAGDHVSAHGSAIKSISYAQQNFDGLTTCFGQLFVASVFYLNGDTERAVPILHNVLDVGRKFQNPTVIFSTLYYLAQIHADRLPAHLVRRILKIAAISPVMHYVLRPLAHAHMTAQGIEIAEETRSTLWATSAADVNLLLTAIEEALG